MNWRFAVLMLTGRFPCRSNMKDGRLDAGYRLDLVVGGVVIVEVKAVDQLAAM